MRQGQQNRRGRGRNNNNNRKGHHHNPLSRSFELNGPDVKIRGTPAHIAEKYISLARDAQSTGDPVLAENYLQHAEHYSRIIMAYRDQFNQPGDGSNGGGHRVRGPGEMGEGFDEFGDDGDMGGDDGFQQPFVPPGHQAQPQPRPQRAAASILGARNGKSSVIRTSGRTNGPTGRSAATRTGPAMASAASARASSSATGSPRRRGPSRAASAQ